VNEKSPTPFIKKSTASRIKKITRRTDQKIPFCPRSGNSPRDRNNVNRPSQCLFDQRFFFWLLFLGRACPLRHIPRPPFSNQRCGGLDNGRISKHSHNWATRTFLPGFEMRPLSSSLSRCGMRPVKSPLRRLRFWFGLYIFHVGLPFWF